MRKQLQLKDLTEAGEVSAEVATLDVIDKDRDVTLSGFFGKQNTRLVAAHDWTQIMLGKGIVEEQGRKAVFAGRLNLDDPTAEQLHSKLRFDMKHPPPMIEWSYGFSIKQGGARVGDFKGEQVRFLQPLEDGSPGADVHEVSPVLIGAGEDTGTLAVKSAGLRFADELRQVMAQVDAAVKRAEAVAQLRRGDGKELSEQSLELLDTMAQNLEKLTAVVTDITSPDPATSEPDPSPAPEQLEEAEEDLQHAYRMLQAQYEAFTATTAP